MGIEAIRYARENKIPFLGICLGMQTTVIESARNVPSYEGANRSEFRKNIINAGMKIVRTSPDGRLVEIVEIENSSWFVAAQFHPELKARPNRPHPLFIGFVEAAINEKNKRSDNK